MNVWHSTNGFLQVLLGYYAVNTGGVVIVDPPPFTPPDPYITSSYAKTGSWLSSSLVAYNGAATEYTQTVGATALWEWVGYPPVDGNYEVYVWYPAPATNNNATVVEYKITTPFGDWIRTVDQKTNFGGWFKIATVQAQKGAQFTVLLTSKQSGSTANTRTGSVMITYTEAAAEAPGSSSAGQDTTTVKVLLNQLGFDSGSSKRATVTNVPDGTAFTVKLASDNSTVHTGGTVVKGVADFSSFEPGAAHSTQYYVECNGVKSSNFRIAKYLMHQAIDYLYLKFMAQSRSDIWNYGSNSVLTRDGHHFDYPLSSLVFAYMANPAYYERLPQGIYRVADTEYTELRVQSEPDIVWLMKFYVHKMLDLVLNKSKQLHAQTKGQLAFFLYLYPHIQQYVPSSLYTQARDLAVGQWGVAGVSSDMQFYDEGTTTDNSLFATQSVIGGIKGAQPPGYAILPNLMMYQVAVRDGLTNPDQYMTAAVNNATWVAGLDLNNPAYTKGQRMTEHVLMTGLAYFVQKFPAQAPAGLQAKIDGWIARMIARSDNMWDLRKYADTAAGDSLDQWTGGLIAYNEPGNVAGFQSSALQAARVGGTTAQKARLKAIGVAQTDAVFGKNPLDVHFSFRAPTDIPGVERGWPTQYPGTGAGDLKWVVGALDGSPKESAYPFAPTAPPGATEGWTNFNTAAIMSSAERNAADTEVKVFNQDFTTEITSALVGATIGLQLKAPLNSDPTVAETGVLKVEYSTGALQNVTVTETSADSLYFRSTFTVPAGVTYVDVSYGIDIYKKTVRVTVS